MDDSYTSEETVKALASAYHLRMQDQRTKPKGWGR